MISEQLTDVEKVQRWAAGEVLFRAGDQPTAVYVVHSGEVELMFSGPNGARKTFRIARPGEILGLGDAVGNTIHVCTATTRTPAQIGSIPTRELLQFLNGTPELWLAVARELSVDVIACWDSMRRMNTVRAAG